MAVEMSRDKHLSHRDLSWRQILKIFSCKLTNSVLYFMVNLSTSEALFTFIDA